MNDHAAEAPGAGRRLSSESSPSAAVLEYVQKHGIRARLIAPQTPMPTVPLAAAALGVGAERIVKTIVLEEKNSKNADGRVVVAIVTGDARVDRARVAQVLGVPTLKLALPETVLRATGFEVGGVPPIAHISAVPVVVDTRVVEHEIVFGGGGDEHHMLEIAPGDIVRLTGAIVAEITVRPDAEQQDAERSDPEQRAADQRPPEQGAS